MVAFMSEAGGHDRMASSGEKKTRGEKAFARLPRFAAGLYDRMLPRSNRDQLDELARDLASRTSEGPLLDVGTGPGRLLGAIHRVAPRIRLYGLDIAEAMVQRARSVLEGIEVDLRAGTIERTDYPSDFFEIVTCTTSLYLWDEPIACLAEIHRILRPGGRACLYEVYQDADYDAVRLGLRENLRGESLLRRLLLPWLLRDQLRITYRLEDYRRLLDRSVFAGAYRIDRITLGNLPMWVRIELEKRTSTAGDTELRVDPPCER